MWFEWPSPPVPGAYRFMVYTNVPGAEGIGVYDACGGQLLGCAGHPPFVVLPNGTP